MSDEESLPPFTHNDAAPFVYFDIVPAYGMMNGAIQIELASRTLTPTPEGGVTVGFMTTARLRCSPAAARYLREGINKALEMIEQPQTATVATTGRLN